jgi:hypothetical protein
MLFGFGEPDEMSWDRVESWAITLVILNLLSVYGQSGGAVGGRILTSKRRVTFAALDLDIWWRPKVNGAFPCNYLILLQHPDQKFLATIFSST